MYTKHKYEGEDLKKLEDLFVKVAKEFPVKKSKKEYDLQAELNALNTECKLVCAMYKLNDFRASSYAYAFTMRKIEELVEYIYQSLSNGSDALKKEVKEWCIATSDFTNAKKGDGSVQVYTNYAYLYNFLNNQQMAIAARYFIEYNIQYLEKNKTEKDYPCRARVLRAAIWWGNQGLLGRFGLKMPFTKPEYDFTPELLIFSTFPSSGKTYLINTMNEMFSELNMIINEQGGVLRIGNEEKNIFAQSSQTKDLITNTLIFDIYPENKKFIVMGKYKPFAKDSEAEWGLFGARYTPTNSIFRTRDSAINSIRCKIAFVDDPSRGGQENTNVDIHKHIIDVFNGDIKDRFVKYSDRFIMLSGTMFAPFDIFANEINKAYAKGIKTDTRFLNTVYSKDKTTVIIVNDCEDEYGKSAFPEFISDAQLEDNRNSMSPYSYACVWRQKPVPPEGLIFAKEHLNFYDKLNEKTLTPYSFAFIDPTRRDARDYFSMPIFRFEEENEEYWLTDAIYERRSSIALVDKVVERIKADKIVHLIIEENVDGSLAARVKDKLKEQNIKWCKVETIYATAKKGKRIAAMADTIINNIRFPKFGLFPERHGVSCLVRDFTQYTAVGKNRFDDSADSICGFAQYKIVGENRENTISFSTKPFI